MTENLESALNVFLKETPAPEGMTGRDIVKKAIEFDNPPRVPYSFVHPRESDFLEAAFLYYLLSEEQKKDLGIYKPERKLGETYYDEWGVGHEVTGRAWDHAFDSPLADLSNLDGYSFPDIANPRLFQWMKPYVKQAHEAGKFVVGADRVLMIERARALMGFEGLMIGPYVDPDRFRALLERLSDLVVAIIERWAALGNVDGFMTWEDFGLQDSLQMSMEMFREFYKPYYVKIVDAAHRNGMHYIWHNCGYIIDLIPDIIDIGVDVIQLDQPKLMGYDNLARVTEGKICHWDCLDIQWCASESVSPTEYAPEVATMMKHLAPEKGGFIARHYPQPWDIGLSEEQQLLIYDAFMENGCSL